ncbi:hypothetical protein [Chryseobacterium sp.]|uniref:TlpA family protein disulfide reductase n=1 Tax=Chryseobacterium sp. TaxID=1871047 RepID=UPI0028A18619|nr:hypothetical protein [Chryseobacterium sp.]
MTKILRIIILLLSITQLSAQVTDLERAKRKYFQANVISYTSTAEYPNPDTDEITVVKINYKVYKPQIEDFEFYSKRENIEEFYKNGNYSSVHHAEKTIYEYENKDNLKKDLINFNSRLYNPTTLLKRNWHSIDDTQIAGNNQTHYSNVESIRHYEGKEIKIEYHIYISLNFTLTKFERKSFVDGQLGQTVSYLFSNYQFSNKTTNFKVTLPQDYALKYYERQESEPLLAKNTEVPSFKAVDKAGKKISFSKNSGKKTLLLFSATRCGYSKLISDFITAPSFKLSSDIEIINIFGSDSKTHVTQYFLNKEVKSAVIPDRKDIEKQFNISGYPILYYVDENGIITESFDDASQILPFLKSLVLK